LPNRVVSGPVLGAAAAVQAVLLLGIWMARPIPLLPGPVEVAQAFGRLWMQQGLGPELFTSLGFSLEALAWSTVISLALAYLTVLPVFRPLTALASKGRFLSLVGFSLVFTLMLSNAHQVKLSLLVFAMSVFFVTSMAAVVAAIPREKFDHARTLRMSEWEVVWEVVVLGTLADAFEILRQNAAIGWMMLTTVEGLARAEGGIGVFLLNQQKQFKLEEVFAVQLLILAVGLVQDYATGLVRRVCCPYADLTLERSEA
jgi:NitT/TauT family transport system permease protein